MLQSYVPKLGLFRAKMLGWGKKKMNRKREMNQCLKAEGKHEK